MVLSSVTENHLAPLEIIIPVTPEFSPPRKTVPRAVPKLTTLVPGGEYDGLSSVIPSRNLKRREASSTDSTSTSYNPSLGRERTFYAQALDPLGN